MTVACALGVDDVGDVGGDVHFVVGDYVMMMIQYVCYGDVDVDEGDGGDELEWSLSQWWMDMRTRRTHQSISWDRTVDRCTVHAYYYYCYY